MLCYVFIAVLLKSYGIVAVILSKNHSLWSLYWTIVDNVPDPYLYVGILIVPLSFAFLFKGRRFIKFLVWYNAAISIMLIIDIWYYRAYNNFLTVHLLKRTFHSRDFIEKILPVIQFKDLIFVADVLILFFLIFRFKKIFTGIGRSILLFILVLSLSTGYIFYQYYNVDVTQKNNAYSLFKVIWTPTATLTNTSPLGYHVFDAIYYFTQCVTEELTSEVKDSIIKWFEQKEENLPDNKYKGIFEGKNLLYINIESLENFVINRKIEDKEITPFLNSLLKNSLYFSEFHEQVNDGVSSDGDFLVNTSVYPLRKGSTFIRFPYNTYNSMPKLLSSKGYSTLAIHPDRPSNWNWTQSIFSIGFDKYIDVLSLNLDEWVISGLSDESYLHQIEPMVISQKQPFYTFMVTQSSHGPFNLPDEKRELGLKAGLDKSYMGGYFESVHYTDKHLSEFIGNLDKQGLLDNTVVVISGDHTGIHKYGYEMPPSEFYEDWWFENRMRIPLIIYYKGMQGEEIKIRGGQVDVLPTLAYLMGIEDKALANTAMGRNLLKTNKDFAVLTSEQYVGTYNDISEKEQAIKGLELADKIIRTNFFKYMTNK